MKTKEAALTYKAIAKNADTLTPVGIYKRLSGEKKFLLESSFQHETKGKYSFIGANPYMEIVGTGSTTVATNLKTGEATTFDMNALDYIKEHFPKIETELNLSFIGGAVGYVAYDMIRQFIDIGDELPDELNMPDAHFMVYDTIIAYEHRSEKAHIIAINVHDETEAALDERLKRVEKELDQSISIEDPNLLTIDFQPQVSKEVFISQVEKALDMIHRKEAEQIVLSQRMVTDLQGDPFSFYRLLRTANPSPYMFYLDFTDYLIIGASPESLVQTTGKNVVTNPIAGTRPRGKNEAEDVALEKELLADKKELIEHDMLVERSIKDLEPICAEASIHVPVHKAIVKYEHVMHIVSEVHGTLKDECTSIDALVACLPAGTVSGSPKQRAMQIISDIEQKRRGVYAGGIGFISFEHDINLAIAIRSLVVKDGKAYLQAGAGIVADSIPEKEYEETLHKAKSLTNLKQ